jgi:hypothetical protein
VKRKFLKCSTPYCSNEVFCKEDGEFHFCNKCKREHTIRILITQAEVGTDIKSALIEAAKTFRSASNISDYFGVSFVTVYNWIKMFFNTTFQEFKRNYICKSSKCYLINIENSSYSRTDYVLRKIKNFRACACIFPLEPNSIMTNIHIGLLEKIIRGNPKIEKVSDGVFTISSSPEPGRVPIIFVNFL